MFFTERSAADFISGDTEGGRPPGRRHHTACNVRGVRTSGSGGWRAIVRERRSWPTLGVAVALIFCL